MSLSPSLDIGTRPCTGTVKDDFLVADRPSAYNVILSGLTLNKVQAIISTTCLTIKFFTDNGEIATVKADQVVAHHCYNTSLEIQKVKKEEPRILSTLRVRRRS